jgi:hypothetical protein
MGLLEDAGQRFSARYRPLEQGAPFELTVREFDVKVLGRVPDRPLLLLFLFLLGSKALGLCLLGLLGGRSFGGCRGSGSWRRLLDGEPGGKERTLPSFFCFLVGGPSFSSHAFFRFSVSLLFFSSAFFRWSSGMTVETP